MNTSPPLPEITLKVVLLSILLAAVLAVSNAFLALKIGMLTSASIPAAVISMGILSLFKQSNILENNLVQTAASAGEAIAGGIVYTVPALIIIRYWTHFNYWENFWIALGGGVLGVMFSIPMRRLLVTDKKLHFPEGKAIAEVLKLRSTSTGSLKKMLYGSAAGAVIELGQTGLKVLANSWEMWFVAQRTVFGFGAGFSAAMIGAGYLIGFRLCLSIFIGAVLSWLVAIPLVSDLYPELLQGHAAAHMAVTLWAAKVRYIGIGAMLLAGVWTFISLFKPFYLSVRASMRLVRERRQKALKEVRTEQDIPFAIVCAVILFSACGLYFLLRDLLPVLQLPLSDLWQQAIVWVSLAYILIFGFIFSAVTAYFSGMVGVSASPGSSIVIASMLLASLFLLTVFDAHGLKQLASRTLLSAEAITIIIGAIITGAAAIANDNIQDLKVGHIIGATPWKQQVMLLLGVVTSAAVIPLIMQLLFDVYGIDGVLPHPGMDPAAALPAPPAALMAAITQAVFKQSIPWNMMWIGFAIIFLMILLNKFVLERRGWHISELGFAIGIYLPLASSTPLFMGGVIALISQRYLRRQTNATAEQIVSAKHRGMLVACGLVAGAALMDVVLAIPFSLAHSPDILSIVPIGWHAMATVLSLITLLLLGRWFYRVTRIV